MTAGRLYRSSFLTFFGHGFGFDRLVRALVLLMTVSAIFSVLVAVFPLIARGRSLRAFFVRSFFLRRFEGEGKRSLVALGTGPFSSLGPFGTVGAVGTFRAVGAVGTFRTVGTIGIVRRPLFVSLFRCVSLLFLHPHT